MKKYLFEIAACTLILLSTVIFFHQTFTRGLLPVPTDTLIGLYHPWLDLYGVKNPAGVTYKNFLITDPVRQQIPWRKLAIDALKEGSRTSWNPYSFSGTPLAANIQAGMFYPLNILFFLLPFPAAWTTLIILQSFLAAAFLFFFLYSKKIHPFVAAAGGIAWGWCGFSVAWLTWGTILQTALWLPLILLSIDRLLESRRRNTLLGWSALGVVAAVSSLLAGHAQVALYVFILSGAYGIFAYWHAPKPRNTWWFIGTAAAIAIASSIQWVPMVRLIMKSARFSDTAVWQKDGWFLPWQHLVQFIAPDFFGNPATLNYWGVWNYGEFIGYIGILPLLLSIYAVIARRDRLTRFLGIACAFVLLFLLPTPIARLPYQLQIPVFSTLQPTRLMVLLDFCLVLLATLGLDHYVRITGKRILVGISIVGIALAGLWIFVLRGAPKDGVELAANLAVAKRNLILPSILFLVSGVSLIVFWFIPKKWKSLVVCGAILLIGFDLFRFGWKFTPFTPLEYFFPQTPAIEFLQSQPGPFRVMSLDARAIPPNVTSYYGIETPEGYDPVYNARYEEFIAALNRKEPNMTPPFGFNRILTLSNMESRLLPLLNVNYVLALEDLRVPDLEFVYQEGSTRIYRYKKALPRVYPVEALIKRTTKQDIMDELYSRTFSPARQAVVEEDIPVSSTTIAAGDSLQVTQWTGGVLVVISNLSADHFIVIANVFDEGWRAYIDGRQTRIYRTNYIFQGVVVPQGAHILKLQYN